MLFRSQNSNVYLGCNVVPQKGVVQTINTNNNHYFNVSQKWHDGPSYEITTIKQLSSDKGFLNTLDVYDKKAKNCCVDEDFKNFALVTKKVTGVMELCISSDNPEINIDFVNAEEWRLNEIKSAFISWGFLLRKSFTKFLDIDPTELMIDFFVHPEDKINNLSAMTGVYFLEKLINGAGYTSYIAGKQNSNLPLEGKRKLILDCLLPNGDLYSELTSSSHIENCDSACYSCLQDYYNKRQHKYINWRLGLDLAKISNDRTAVPEYSGKDNYWSSLIESRVKKYVEIENRKTDLSVKLDWYDSTICVITRGNDIFALVHPLWSNKKIDEVCKSVNAKKIVFITDFVKTLQLIDPREDRKSVV